MTGLPRVRDLALADWNGCAVRTDRRVICWGERTTGVSGQARTTRKPRVIRGLRAHSLTGAGDVMCAIAVDRRVRCWGTWQARRHRGPRTIPGLAGVQRIGIDGRLVCATARTGAVRCHDLNTGRNIRPLPGVAAAGLAVTHGLVCAAQRSGRLFCEHNGAYTADTIGQPFRTPLTAIADVEVGEEVACARTTGSLVYCWDSRHTRPLPQPDLHGQTFAIAGWEVCRITGAVTCRGTLGGPSETPAGLDDAVTVTGGLVKCALRASATVACWGNLPLTREAPAHQFTGLVAPVPELAGVTGLEVGRDFACAAAGIVRCWGEGDRGQLGNGVSGADHRMYTPSTVLGVADATDVTVGSAHACALRATATVACWGETARYNTSPPARPTATPVPNLANVAQIAAGHRHTCARTTAGSVHCWGLNHAGALGPAAGVAADTDTGLATVQVPIDGVTDISASEFGTCAVRADGTVWCWGAAVTPGAVTPAPHRVPGVRVAGH